MLDTKDLKILHYINKNREWNDVASLSGQIGFTRGDFYYHINHINVFLKQNGYEEVDFSSKNKKIDYKSLKKAWTDYFKTSKGYALTSSERLWFLIILFTIEKKLTLKDMAFFFSKSVNNAFIDVNNCIHEIIFNYHNHYNVGIENRGRGYVLTGEQNEFFRLLYYSCYQIVNTECSGVVIPIFLKLIDNYCKNDSDKSLLDNHIEIDRIIKRKFLDENMSKDNLTVISLFITILLNNIEKYNLNSFKFNRTNEFIGLFKGLPCYSISSKTIDEIKNVLKHDIEEEESLKVVLATFLFPENIDFLFSQNENKLTSIWMKIKDKLMERKYILRNFIEGYNFFSYLLSLKFNVTNDFEFQHESKFATEKDYVIFMDFLCKNRDIVEIFRNFIHRELTECEEENIMYLIYCNISNIYVEQIRSAKNITIISDMDEEFIEGYVSYILEIYKHAKITNVISLEDYTLDNEKYKNDLILSDYSEKLLSVPFLYIPYKKKNVKIKKTIIKKEVMSILEDNSFSNNIKSDKITELLMIIDDNR
ncbi:hypothetical protein [Spiroplasma endosymbiont of Aspidapion aeneum]|uniref:hypothetical protein n=1 Tax=Spiroplasma endosymbiont of Aspidapion aeneum TaxID=3066276 RepID=UPI00313C5DEB